MKRHPLLFAVAVLGLSACDRPAPWARTPSPASPSALTQTAQQAPPVVRSQAIRWDGPQGQFELNGQPLKAGRIWTFDGSTEGFVPVGGDAIPAVPTGLRLTNTASDPVLRSPKALELNGGRYSLVLVRLTRVRASKSWDGTLYYSTLAHPEAIGFHSRPIFGGNPLANETMILVFDMAHPKSGGGDWTGSLIDQIRLDTDDTAGGEFVIHQIAISQNPGLAALGVSPAPP